VLTDTEGGGKETSIGKENAGMWVRLCYTLMFVCSCIIVPFHSRIQHTIWVILLLLVVASVFWFLLLLLSSINCLELFFCIFYLLTFEPLDSFQKNIIKSFVFICFLHSLAANSLSQVHYTLIIMALYKCLYLLTEEYFITCVACYS